MIIIDRHTHKMLTDTEILAEVNRDHSDEWEDYTMLDLQTTPDEVVEWIDPQYFIIGG